MVDPPGLECRPQADLHRRAAVVARRAVRGFGEEVTEGESPENKKEENNVLLFREPAGARTQDPNIKSVVLYLLSYGFSVFPNFFVLVVQM